MSELSDEKILEIIKTKGNPEAVKYVKGKLKVDLRDAKELVDDLIAKNPGISPAKSSPLLLSLPHSSLLSSFW